MDKKTAEKSNRDIKRVSPKPVNAPKNINRNGKNSMRYTKIDEK